MERRSLLKLFSAGAIVAPVINGITDESARALIIRPPEIEVAEAPKVVPFNEVTDGDYDATLYLRSRATGRVIRLDTVCYVTDLQGGLQLRQGRHFIRTGALPRIQG